VIPPGQTCETPIHSVDLFPTLLELTGAAPPKDQPLDGVSYLGLLRSGGKGTLPRDALYWHFPGYLGAGADTWRTLPVAAVRQGDWKLLEFLEDRRVELYNLRDDPGQQTDLAAERPEERDRLLATLHAWQADVGAKFPAARTADVTPPAAKAKPGKRKRRAGEAASPTS
jgi:arylsulfatase A-like enzyme